MEKQLIKGIILTMVCSLVLLGLPSLAVEEEIQSEAQAVKSKVSNRIKNRVVSKIESGTRKVLKFIPWGEAVGDLFFGSEAEKSLEIQKEILETNQNTLSQIKVMAQDAMRLKRKIEEVDRLRRTSVRLGQDFSKSSYSKMILALGDQVLGISCNPGDYIPNTSYTRKLKRNLDVKYGRERRFFRGSQQFIQGSRLFLKSSRKALSYKERHYPNTKAFQKKLVQATVYDRHVEEYVASRNLLLAQEHEEFADSLLKHNQGLETMLQDEKANMSAAEVAQIQHIINKNVSKALFHKAKANALLQEASKDSKSDKEKLAALEEHALAHELIIKELEALRNREKPSWIGSKQEGKENNRKQKLAVSRGN